MVTGPVLCRVCDDDADRHGPRGCMVPMGLDGGFCPCELTPTAVVLAHLAPTRELADFHPETGHAHDCWLTSDDTLVCNKDCVVRLYAIAQDAEHAALDALTVTGAAQSISDTLNASYAPDADPELVLWRRLTKVSEEAGEVQDALRGYVGENPRKGVTHTREDLITELLDCAGASLGGIAHLTGGADTLHRLAARLVHVQHRLTTDTTP